MEFYRRHWFDVGLVLAGVSCVILALVWNDISRVQLFLAMNFIALLLHNFEEYRWPGTLPGEMNGGLFKSDIPDRYPFNAKSAMIVNPLGAYTIYLLPILFPKIVWLGLGPVLLGISQLPTHLIFMPIKTKQLYSAGLVTCVLFSIFGILYIKQIYADDLVRVSDWVYASVYFVFIGAVIVQGPIHFFKDRNYPHRFTRSQLGRWADSSGV